MKMGEREETSPEAPVRGVSLPSLLNKRIQLHWLLPTSICRADQAFLNTLTWTNAKCILYPCLRMYCDSLLFIWMMTRIHPLTSDHSQQNLLHPLLVCCGAFRWILLEMRPNESLVSGQLYIAYCDATLVIIRYYTMRGVSMMAFLFNVTLLSCNTNEKRSDPQAVSTICCYDNRAMAKRGQTVFSCLMVRGKVKRNEKSIQASHSLQGTLKQMRLWNLRAL